MSKASFELFRGELLGAGLALPLQALSIAEEAHEGVLRKDGKTPYIEHPMKVASLLFDLGIRDETILATAILHDVVEDTACTLIDIKNKVSGELLDVLDALTIKSTKNQAYFDKIKLYPEAVIIKLADRVHNLSTLYCFSPEKKERYIEETIQYIYPLIKYAQHHYYKYSNVIRIFDLWIESIVDSYVSKG